MPNRKDEAWKYTGLRMLDKAGVQLAAEVDSPVSRLPNPKPLVGFDLTVNMIDGQFLEQIGDLPAGMTILPMADAIKREAQGLKELLALWTCRGPKKRPVTDSAH